MDLRRRTRDRYHRILIGMAKRGHEGAFRRLYGQLYTPVCRYVLPRVHVREDAEDLVSLIFHKFLRGLDHYDPHKGSVWTWAMTLSRNSVIDFHRTRREHEPLDDLADTLVGDIADPLERLVQDEEAHLLHGVLADHPAEVREMFALHYGQRMSYGEIAQIMGLSETAVKQRFSRTTRRLRAELTSRSFKGGENEAMAQHRKRVEESA